MQTYLSKYEVHNSNLQFCKPYRGESGIYQSLYWIYKLYTVPVYTADYTPVVINCLTQGFQNRFSKTYCTYSDSPCCDNITRPEQVFRTPQIKLLLPPHTHHMSRSTIWLYILTLPLAKLICSWISNRLKRTKIARFIYAKWTAWSSHLQKGLNNFSKMCCVCI